MEIKKFENTIQLTNDGELSLFFIGAGSAFSKKYFQTNLLIIKGQTHILVDCGTLCSYALSAEYNFPVSNIDNLILTHLHADHMGGVEEMALIGKYVGKKKINLIIQNSFKKTLWKNSLSGGIKYSDSGVKKFNDYFNQVEPKLIQKKPFEIWETDFNGINVKLFRTCHVTEKPLLKRNSQFSQGVIIDNRVLFTGDTQFNKAQLDWIVQNYDIEAIFHDCDISDTYGGVHAPYNLLMTLPASIKGKMYLCHYNANRDKKNARADGFADFVQRGQYYVFD